MLELILMAKRVENNNMVRKKQKQLSIEKIPYLVMSIYVLGVSLFMVSRTVYLWLFIFFILVSLFSLFAFREVLSRNYTRKLLRLTLVAEAILATFLIYPAPVAAIADFIGAKCQNLLGGVEQCSESITFSSIKLSLVLMVPMVFLAALAYQKTKKKSI